MLRFSLALQTRASAPTLTGHLRSLERFNTNKRKLAFVPCPLRPLVAGGSFNVAPQMD